MDKIKTYTLDCPYLKHTVNLTIRYVETAIAGKIGNDYKRIVENVDCGFDNSRRTLALLIVS